VETPTGGDMTVAFEEALTASEPDQDTSPVSDPTPESPTSASEALPATESVETPASAEVPTETDAAPTPQPESTDSQVVSASTEADTPVAPVTPEETPAGEPPEWRWQDILSNARDTTAKETETRVRQEMESQYAWAKDLTQASDGERQNLLSWYQVLNTDPVTALSQLSQAIAANPELKARLDATQGTAQAVPETPEPQADLQNADGTLVYSADKLKEWQGWTQQRLSQRLNQQFEERLAPLQRAASHAESQRIQTTALNEAQGAIDTFREDADFMAHTADIKTTIEQDARLAALADHDPRAALDVAWARVYRAKVLPKKLQGNEAEVLEKLQRKATAGSVNPNAPTAITPQRFRSDEAGFAEALAHFNETGR
tara:strand:+ start:16 stop:1137 length:1122 start_codon:yes stop_codon:yes gene_type:complete